MTEAPTPIPTPPSPPKLPRLVCALLAGAITLLQMSPEWFERYQPGYDESLMLQSGIRMSRGQGLTSIWTDRLEDISQPEYEHLTTWPPVYGLMVAGLMRLLGEPDRAAAVLTALKALTALAGAYGWLRLANRILPAPATLLFALGLSSLFFGNSPFGNSVFVGPSHLFLWAVIPMWLHALLRAIESGRPTDFALAGLPAGLAIGIRYAGAYLTPVTAAAALLLTAGPLGRRFAGAALAGLPTAGMAGAILLFNSLSTDRAPWILSDTQAGWYWENLLNRNPLTIWFAFGFGLEETVYKLRPSWRFESDFTYFLPWYVLLAVVGVTAVRAARERFTTVQIRFGAVVGLAAAALVGLLALAATRTSPEQAFNPLNEQRYYSELLPALGIVWLAIFAARLDMAPKASAGWWLAAAAVAALIGLECRFGWFAIRTTARRFREVAREGIRAEPPLETLVRRQIADSPVAQHRVFDSFDGAMATLLWRDDVHLHTIEHLGEPAALPKTGNRRPVYVMVIVRWDWNVGGRTARPSRDTKVATAYARFWGLQPIGKAFHRGDLCEVWGGIVPPYRAGERPLPPTDEPVPPTADESVPGFPRH